MNTEQHLNKLAADQFMQPVIWYDRFFEVETSHGTEYVEQNLVGLTMNPPLSAIAEYCEGEIYTSRIQVVDGYGAYLSAPGYMDRTELCVFETEADAIDYLIEYYTA